MRTRSSPGLMTRRRLHSVLWLAAIVLLAGAVAAPIMAWLMPLRINAAKVAAVHGGGAGASASGSLPALAEFEPAWKAPLRRSLAEAPATAAAEPEVAASTEAGLPVSLVGTNGKSLAMLRGAEGAIDVRGAGESLSGVEVVSVRPGSADVRFNGRVIRLTVPPQP